MTNGHLLSGMAPSIWFGSATIQILVQSGQPTYSMEIGNTEKFLQ